MDNEKFPGESVKGFEDRLFRRENNVSFFFLEILFPVSKMKGGQ